MNVLILQPPLLQLNTAYPSGAYLKSFFTSQGHNAKWIDLNNKFFYEIFSPDGLKKLFKLSAEQALKKAEDFEKKGDFISSYNIKKYLSQSTEWISYIKTITDILCCKESSQEVKHNFLFSPFAPRGDRMNKYLENLDHNLTSDDAFSLATFAIADLADYITIAFDSNFSLIRYAESLTVNETSFDAITKACNSNLIKYFYIPLLEKLFLNKKMPFNTDEEFLVAISIPFAGTFTHALATGKFFKENFKNCFVSMGGGFVNTELRNCNEQNLFMYTDALSFDRGYGSYKEFFKNRNSNQNLYKLKIFTKEKIIEQKDSDPQTEHFENQITMNLIPDFSDIDFSIYPRMADDTNPMHRLWNDGAWIKAYLAHGCYWHKCAFCDTNLDYIKNYKLTNVSNLYDGLYRQALEHKIYGIHFVDEAAPPVALVQFARKNIYASPKLSFWGNIRFEKTFSRDITDFLSAAGLIGVSGGIEIATGQGLDSINKGIEIESIVASCCAFKESGILVHAYMIYGYWNQNEQDIINSMETLRQFFKNGLLDSSFWHKFVLTRNSTVYQDYLKNPEKYSLKPIEPKEKAVFANNELHFEGENKFNKYGPSLDAALEAWMHGEKLNTPVVNWFNFKVCHPTVDKNFILKAIEKYEKNKNNRFAKKLSEDEKKQFETLLKCNSFNSKEERNILFSSTQKIYWLGGKIIPEGKNNSWFYLDEKISLPKNAPPESYRGKGLCILPF